MSEDTPECAKLHYLKNNFCENMPPNHLQCVPRPRDLKFPQK